MDMNRKMQLLLAAAVSIATAGMAQEIIPANIGFTSPYFDADLAGQQGWGAVLNTGANAFNVTDSAGSGYADTTSTVLNTNAGNYVYLDSTALGSDVGDEWDGVMDFTISTTTNHIDFSDFFRIGLSIVTTNGLDNNPDDITLRLRSLGTSGTVSIRAYGTEGSDTVMDVDKTALGWDPVATNQITDDLRLSWKLRETTVAATYTLICSLENLTTPGTNTSQAISLVSSNAYATSGLYTLMGRSNQAGIDNTEEEINVTIDNLSIIKSTAQPVKLYPTPVMASAGNAVVDLSWADVTEAVSYDVTRSDTIDGVYATLIYGITTNGYQDTGVVNGNEYYYKVTSVNGGVTADSDPVFANPDTAVTGTFLDTTFAATDTPPYVSAALTGQNSWQPLDAHATPAFQVDAAGAGFADTEPFAAGFDTNTGNGVFFNRMTSNTVGAAWNGTMVFTMTMNPEPGYVTNIYYDITEEGITNSITTNMAQVANLPIGAEVFDLGITADPAHDFNPRTGQDALITFRKNGNGLTLHLNAYSGNAPTMLEIPYADLGWDPEWKYHNPSNAPIYETDPITLDWTIRKTEVSGYYMGAVSVSVGGNSFTGEVAYTDQVLGHTDELYLEDVVYFGMKHATEALPDGNMEMLHFSIDSLRISHTNDGFVAVVPHTLTVVPGNLTMDVFWIGSPEADSYDVYISDGTDPDAGPWTITNVTSTSVTDTGLVDKRTYFYKVVAKFAAGDSDASDVLAARALGVVVPEDARWGGRDDVIDGGNAVMAPGNLNVSAGAVYFTDSGVGDGSGALSSTFGNARGYDEQDLYGFVQITTNDTIKSNRVWVKNESGGTPDEFRAQRNTGTGLISGLIYITPTSPLDTTTTDWGMDINASGIWKCRGAIRNAGIWYASETFFTGEADQIVSIKDEKWAAFTPATISSTELMVLPTNYVSVANLTSIDAVGAVYSELADDIRINEIKVFGGTSLDNYDYWTDSVGLYNENTPKADDPDADGADNVWEWGMGGDPLDANDRGITTNIEYRTDGTNFVFIYPRLKSAARPGYFVTETYNLQYVDFENHETNYTIEAGGTWTNEPDFERVRNIIPHTNSAAPGFFKLNIE
jgi:hypothetical protein